MTKPRALRPTSDQQAVFRSEITDRLRDIFDFLPIVERIRDEMGAGYSANTITDGRGGGDGLTVVERLASGAGTDPAAWAAEALALFDEMVGNLRNVHDQFRRIMPMTPKEVTELNQWHDQARVPICALCELPIPDKVHRIDDQAYHATTCYYRVWRQGRVG